MLQSEPILWPAPGKLNQFLHITGRRDDGYHTLQTIFQFIGVGDQLQIQANDTSEITIHHQYDHIPIQADLTLRAARLLQSESGCRQGAEIKLVKNLPTGAGLGGGSSDAATVLLVLNYLWGLNLGKSVLARIGLQLGADVPIFVYGRACWAEGIGEDFTPIDIPEPAYLVVYPKVHVSTAAIFSAAELTRHTPPITIADFLAGQAGNDCESLVRKLEPQVDKAMQWLGKYSAARLTGTGACVFAAFETEEQAHEVAAKCTNDWQTFVTRGYNHSPLHLMLNEKIDI